MKVGSSSSRARKGLRQPTARLRLAEQDVGDRIAGLLARIPGLQHGGDLAEPRHGDRAAALQHDDRVRVDRGDALDEFVLPMRQIDVRTVHAFAVPLAVEPDEQQRGVGRLGRSRRRARSPRRRAPGSSEAQHGDAETRRGRQGRRIRRRCRRSGRPRGAGRANLVTGAVEIFMAGLEVPGVDRRHSPSIRSRARPEETRPNSTSPVSCARCR